jgi:two-component system, NarL family, response regulator LiaR
MQEKLYCQDSLSTQHLFHLSNRELEVLKLLIEGYSNSEIATALHLSIHTIKTHVRSLMNKFAVEHRVQIAVFAIRNQLVE